MAIIYWLYLQLYAQLGQRLEILANRIVIHVSICHELLTHESRSDSINISGGLKITE